MIIYRSFQCGPAAWIGWQRSHHSRPALTRQKCCFTRVGYLPELVFSLLIKIYWTTKERYNFCCVSYLSQLSLKVDVWDKILFIAIFHIGLYNKFRDQSSVKGLSRNWDKFQKVHGWRIFTSQSSMCVDRRNFYFVPNRKKHKMRNQFVCIGTQEC